MFKGFINKAQQLTQSAFEMGSDWLNTLMQNDFKQAGQDKISEVVHRFNQVIPALEEAGFGLKDVSLSVGISPYLLANLRIISYLSEAEEKAVLEKYAHLPMVSWLLPPLYKARNTQKNIKIHQLTFSEIAVEIGLFPSVIIRYQNPTIH